MDEQLPSDTRLTAIELTPEQRKRALDLYRESDGCYHDLALACAHVIRLRDEKAELIAALKPFAKPEAFDQAAQIRALISQISGNPVNGADAFIWWMQKHFSVQHFKDAVAAITKATQP